MPYGESRELEYNESLNRFWMGSGGGGGYNDGHKLIRELNEKIKKSERGGIATQKLSNISRGGDGGGGLFLNIFGHLHLREGAKIQCNGQDGHEGYECGGGGGDLVALY